MTDADPGSETTQVPGPPGERLRQAREAGGLSLADVAARTRIPQRHLESIESGNYSNLPSPTYAMGFARAYARAVGVDEVSLAADVRRDLDRSWDRPTRTVPVYEMEDPTRTPSRGLVWSGVLVAVLLLVGLGLWYGSDLLRGGGTSESSVATADEVAVPIPQTVAPPPAPSTGGQVTITATDEVWVRIYDAAGTTLLMKTMAPGERYDVPAGANEPQINVGRPDKLAITVNGSAVPPLGDGRVAIKDVPIAAAALLARGAGTPAAGATPTPTPRASAATPASRPAARPLPSPTSTPAPPAAATRAEDAGTGNTSGT